MLIKPGNVPEYHEDIFIVLTDDDEDDCDLFLEVARETIKNLRCHFAYDGEELMVYLDSLLATETILPDLLVLDVNMPRMNGKEALRRIKQHRVLRKIPVVILTTSTDAALKAELESLGACAFYSKPHDLNRFKHVVAEMLQICLDERKNAQVN